MVWVFVSIGFFFFFFNDTATTEIYTLSLHDALPILVRFAVPEQHLAGIQRYRRNRLPVLVSPSKADTVLTEGVLSFVDNSVDTTTGTVLLKGEFPNRDNALW